ncbi:MAG: hypothetical protein LBU45_00105 [Azoarcus sp.]|jgi:hypothetical protein|nr:hypothetical protein [Azoarcus sp.]
MIGFQFDVLSWMLLLIVLLGRRWLLMLLAALLIVVPLPVGNAVSLLSILRGLFGSLSVTTVIFLLALALQNSKRMTVFAGRETRWLPPLIAAVSLLFYPTALGLGRLDSYEWGHDEALVLPLTVGVLALMAWLARWRVSALALVLALALWRLRMLESTNLWDYLLDPLLALTALGVLAARWLQKIRTPRNHSNDK